MKVIKRDGTYEDIEFDKITRRIKLLCSGRDKDGAVFGPPLDLDPIKIAMKVIEHIKDGITTRELDEFAAESAAGLGTDHPEYSSLAGRIMVSNHHKNTIESFSETMKRLYQYHDVRGEPSPLISRELYKLAERHGKRIDAEIDYLRDYNFDYFGIRTLERAYMIKYQTGIHRYQERPQHMYMRVALGIWGDTDDFQPAFETYHRISQGYYTHATPTLYNAGTPRPQLSSCFLMPIPDDMGGIYKALSDCAEISKWAGGIGLHLSDVRPKGSYIRGTNGHSNGILPMLKVFNDTARYVDQCFSADTLVYTQKGPVPISSLGVGDCVVTHDGTLQKVTRVLCHQFSPGQTRPETLRIMTETSIDPIVVTGEHQVQVVRDPVSNDIATLRERLNNGYTKPEWMDAKDVQTDDYVCYPDAKYSEKHTIDIPELTEDSLYEYGKTGFGPGGLDARIFTLPLKKCRAFLKGMVENQSLCYEKTSQYKELIRYLSWRCGMDTVSGIGTIKWNNLTMSRISKIESDDYDGDLYDLEVENNHTYLTANLGTVHNGGGKRMGSFAMYLEPWHPEIMEFLEAKLPTGHEAKRAKDLFYALWVPDLFMKKVKDAFAEEKAAKAAGREEKPVYWNTYCPDECPGLSDAWGTAFEELYAKYEHEGKVRKRMNIKQIWTAVLNSQRECGVPYICYKDAANRKSNQQNLGTIRSSNLCTEIIEYSDTNEYATCNLASIALPKHLRVNSETGLYEVDHSALMESAEMATRNLNKVIDVNFYPVPETKLSNDRHRPIGVGVQGLADLLHMMRVPWEVDVEEIDGGKGGKGRIVNPQALQINSDIFETIYYGAVKASMELAREHGPYQTFAGSPASQGKLQFDLWGYTPESGRYDWDALKAQVVEHGLRNSLLMAPMPTASTAQILSNTECFEPYNHNLYVRRVLAGEFTIVNKHLQKDMIRLGLWNPDLKQRLIRSRGSIQDRSLFPEIPDDLRNLYMTAYELKQRTIIDMAVSRGRFICQSQSLNLFVSNPNDNKLTNMHLYSWSQGLKTGIYYLRRDTVSKAQQFTVAPRNFSANRRNKAGPGGLGPTGPSGPTDPGPAAEAAEEGEEETVPLCRIDNPDCEMCGA